MEPGPTPVGPAVAFPSRPCMQYSRQVATDRTSGHRTGLGCYDSGFGVGQAGCEWASGRKTRFN